MSGIGKSDKKIKNVNYKKAIQNLTDILIDSEKFDEMAKNIFDAIDTDQVGVI